MTSEKCIWRIWSDWVDLYLLIVQITVDLLSGWIENATTPLLCIWSNFGEIYWFDRLSNIFTKLVIDQRKKRPLKIITAKVSNGDKRFCNSRDWSHKKTWSSLRASSGRSYASYVNAHESYVRELNRENICVVVRKRKSWAWFNLNVHARPSIHCLYLFTHVKSTLQWKSTPLYLACVEGVQKGRGRELVRSTTREGGRFLSFLPRSLHMLSRAQIPASPFNACHAGYIVLAIASPLAARARLLTRYPQMEILLSG